MNEIYTVSGSQLEKGGDRSKTRQFSLRPATFLMLVSACYNTSNPRRRFQTVLLWLYQSVVILFFLFYLVRTFAYSSNTAISYISSCLATFQCFGSCIVCWKTFSPKYGHFHRAISLWNETISKMTYEGVTIDFGYFWRWQVILVSVAALLQITCVSTQFVINYILLPTGDELHELGYNISFTAPFEDTALTRLVLTIPVCFQVIALVGPAFYLIVISVMLRTGFRGFTKHLKQIISSNSKDPLEHLDSLRLIHLDLCQVVSMLDQDFCFLYGNVYFWTLGMGIVILYVLVKFPQSLFGALIYLFYLGLTLGMMFSLSIFAAFVHEEAHSPLQTIYYINVNKATQERSSQLNLFLSKLTGTQVGFTTFGLLTITKEFILTIAGVFLTYFAVLYTTV